MDERPEVGGYRACCTWDGPRRVAQWWRSSHVKRMGSLRKPVPPKWLSASRLEPWGPTIEEYLQRRHSQHAFSRTQTRAGWFPGPIRPTVRARRADRVTRNFPTAGRRRSRWRTSPAEAVVTAPAGSVAGSDQACPCTRCGRCRPSRMRLMNTASWNPLPRAGRL